MPIYSKESLEILRHKTDLVAVISPYVDLKPAGSSYKGICPFHDEKSPSFMIQKGDGHYHCFGCGAHGDAIHFLMAYQKMNFSDAVETLAEKFHVHLDVVEGKSEYQGPPKKILKEALEKGSRFFHFYLLHTAEGRSVIEYLFQRGITLKFIRQFQIGLAPSFYGMMRKVLHEQGVSDEAMLISGLIAPRSAGGFRDFFSDRITFPIHNPAGEVIGFSARKYKEETFGGKYINTSETPLFKKSRVLFGLNYSRRRIAKERRVIIVEGQIDALRLIHEGFNFAVAGQGTAFGEGHVQELQTLGISMAYLALDSDEAGMAATAKIGDLLQNEGIEVSVISLPVGADPDSFIRDEGSEKFKTLLGEGKNYLDFLVEFHSRGINIFTPAGKNEIVRLLTKQIRGWKHSLMVHESLKRLANLLSIPEHMIGVGEEYTPNLHIRKSANVGLQTIDPVRILESDFLRWLLLMGGQASKFVAIADKNIEPKDLLDPICQRMYTIYLQRARENLHCDILSLIDNEEDQEFLSDIMTKKIYSDRAEQLFIETVQKILDRNWMEKREELKRKIQSGLCSDEEALLLMKDFDLLKKNPPKVVVPESVLNV